MVTKPYKPEQGPVSNPTPRTDFSSIAMGAIETLDYRTKSYQVKLDSGTTISDCYSAAGGIFAPLLGYSIKTVLTPGTRVVVMVGNPSFIIQTLPTVAPGPDAAGHGYVGMPEASTPVEPRGNGPLPEPRAVPDEIPEDMLEGELQIGSAMGVAVDFLTNLIRLRANRAVVEVGLYNDLVRICAQHFRMELPTGTHVNFDDGRPTAYEAGTIYPHEQLGHLAPGAEVQQSDIPGVPALDATAEEHLRTGRWRWEKYVGYLGDVLHHWVMEPEKVLGSMVKASTGAEADRCRSGMSHEWRGPDGTLLWQSVGEIAFERVCRIIVPTPLSPLSREDLEAQYKQLNETLLQAWETKPQVTDITRTCFMLRDYAKHLSNYVSLARFHQMAEKGQFELKKESDLRAPDWNANDHERERVNAGRRERFIDTYSTFRMFKDGTIMLHQGQGSGVLLRKGSVTVYAAVDVDLEAAGDVRIRAGRDILLQSRRNISVLSLVGGLTIKARSWIEQLCERGHLFLKSDASQTLADSYTSDADNPAPKFSGAGVVIDSTAAGMTLNATGKVVLRNDGGVSDEERSINIEAPSGNVRVHAGKHLEVLAEVLTEIRTRTVQLFATKVLGTIHSIDFPRVMKMIGGVLSVRRLISNRVDASGYVGPSKYVSQPLGPLSQPDISDTTLQPTDPNIRKSRMPASRPNFQLPKYETPDEIFESPAQEALRNEILKDHPDIGAAGYVEDTSTGKLLPGRRTDTTQAAYGATTKTLTYNGTRKLLAPDTAAPGAPVAAGTFSFRTWILKYFRKST